MRSLLSRLKKVPLLRPNRSWQGPQALAPAELCYAVLDVFALMAVVVCAVSVVMVYAQFHASVALFSIPSFQVYCLLLVIACSPLICRCLPFRVRFGLTASVLFLQLALNSLEIGLPPSTPLITLLLLTALTLFFGLRVGLAGMAPVATFLLVGAWGWTHGWLPLPHFPAAASAQLLDFHAPLVWARALPVMAAYVLAMMVALHFVLRRLGTSLREAQASLRLLETEKAKVQQRSAELFVQSQQLRISEAKFRTLFEQSHDAILLLDGKNILSANRRTEEIFACRQEEIVGFPSSTFSPPLQADGRPSAESASEKLRAALAGQSQHFEWRFQRRDGTAFEAEVDLHRIEADGAVFLQAIVRDVTQRRQTETALKKSEANYRAIFENAAEGIFQTSVEGRGISLNPAMARMHGFETPAEALAALNDLAVQAYADPGDRERMLQLLARDGRVENLEVQLMRKDGRRFWGLINVRRLHDPEGQPYNEGTVLDITERKRMEGELLDAQLFNEAILNSVQGLVFLFDMSGRLCRWNKRHEEVLGYSAAELSGMPGLTWFREPDRSRIETMMREVVLNGRAETEAMLVTKAGKAIPYYFSGVKLQIGGHRYLTGIGLDLSALKRAEAESRALQSQLIQAQKMEAVGQLAGGVAHDFNNILTAILMHLDLLRSDANTPPELLASLGELEQAAHRATSLTRQLLVFSRRQVVQMTVLDLDLLLGNLLKMLRRLIGDHIGIEFRGAASTPWVTADGGMLEQVVLNLVVNARDAMPQGGRITLTTSLVDLDAAALRAHRERQEGRFVRLTVGDTGCGMDEDTQGRIFEPFFTTKEPGKGTGLGLATVYGIVQQHRGWIEVESTVGLGTVFRVFLPSSPTGAAAPTTRKPGWDLAGGSETVLVVEDDASVRDLACFFLQRTGYHVFAAANGLEALATWAQRQGQVDLVVTDMLMPAGPTGLDLIRRMRQDKAALKAILMSGYTGEFGAADIHTDEVVFLAKPFEGQDLVRAVRHCLDAR